MVKILMMSGKLPAPAPLKIKMLENKCYDVIYFVYDGIKKLITRIKLYCTRGCVTKIW